MAKCKKIEVKPVPPPAEYRLSLSAIEAEALHALLGEMHGYPKCEPEYALDRVFYALDGAGVTSRQMLVDGWEVNGDGARVRWAE